jgi:hypothetical protein
MTAVGTPQRLTGVRLVEAPDRAAEVAAWILSAALVAAVAGVALQTAVDLFDFWALDRRVEILLADSDVGVFAWASVAATVVVALGALLLAKVTPASRTLLWFVAATAAYLSLDDQLGVHERIGDVADRADSLVRWEPARVLWPLVYLPLLAAFFLALRHVAGRLPARHARFVVVGIALLVAAVVFELLSVAIVRAGFDRDSVVYALEVVLEEGAELAGWILIAGALLSAFVLGLREPAVTMPGEGG